MKLNKNRLARTAVNEINGGFGRFFGGGIIWSAGHRPGAKIFPARGRAETVLGAPQRGKLYHYHYRFFGRFDKRGRLWCSFRQLQPKSGFLPEAGRGRPKLLEVEDGAYETGQPVSRPLSRPSPTANLAGNWKGDPLIREVRGLKFTPM